MLENCDTFIFIIKCKIQNTKKKDQNLRFEFMNKHIRNQSKRREKRVSLSLKGFHYKT